MININIKNTDNYFPIKIEGKIGYILKKGDNKVPEEIYETLKKDKWFIFLLENNLATIGEDVVEDIKEAVGDVDDDIEDD